MKKSLFRNTLLVWLLSGAVYAQIPDSTQRKIDSIRRVLPGATVATRHDLTFGIAYDLFDVDNTEAVKYADEAFGLAKELGDSAKLVRSGRIYGQLLRRVGEVDKAIEVMESVIEVAERRGYEKDLRILCNSLAIAHTFRGQYDRALEYDFRSLELRQKNTNKLDIAIAENGLGTTFYLIGIYDRAAEFFKNSLTTDSTNDYTSDVKVGLALCYGRLNYLKESRSLIESVQSQYGSNIASITKPRIEYGLGYVDLKEGKLASAKSHFEVGYTLAAVESNKTYMSDCLAKLGEIYLTTGDLRAAEQCLLQSDSLANQIGYRNGREVANMALAKLYTLNNDHNRASHAKSNIIALKDSSINQGVIENIYRHQFDFYQKQNKKTITTQAELLALQAQALKYHLISNIVSWTCAVLLVSFVVLLYRSNKFRKQIAIELEKRVHERTAELRRTVESLEKSQLERNFMLDGISKRLTSNLATFRGLGFVAATYEGTTTEFAKHVDKASDDLTNILTLIARSKK